MKELNKSAFDQLFRDNYSDLVHYAHRFMRDQNRSEDVVQDLFVDLWNKRQQLSHVESMPAYLRRSTQFKCFDQLRKDKRNPVSEFEFPKDLKSSDDLSIEEEMISKEKITHIRKVIDTLPDKGRSVFLMSRSDGMSYKEIAETLDVSLKTVEYHMMQNLKFLRKALFCFLYLFLF